MMTFSWALRPCQTTFSHQLGRKFFGLGMPRDVMMAVSNTGLEMALAIHSAMSVGVIGMLVNV